MELSRRRGSERCKSTGKGDEVEGQELRREREEEREKRGMEKQEIRKKRCVWKKTGNGEEQMT